MTTRTVLEADLSFSVTGPSGPLSIEGRLVGTDSDLELYLSRPREMSRGVALRALREAGAFLAQRGLRVTVRGPQGPLVRLGDTGSPLWQRMLLRSHHVRLLRPLAAYRLRSGASEDNVVGLGRLQVPPTPFPLAPTVLRRHRVRSTTHDPHGGGAPRLVLLRRDPDCTESIERVLYLRRGTTTIGSADDCIIRLPGIAALQGVVRRDEDDEYHYDDLAPATPGTVHGGATDSPILRTGARLELGGWTLGYAREEFADHGRPFGGRVGGETGHQRPQPTYGEVRTLIE